MLFSAVDLFFSKYDECMLGKTLQERYIVLIDVGIDALLKVSSYIKNGAVGALSVKQDFNLNFEIEFNSSELMIFLKEYFPKSLLGNSDIIRQNIIPERRYVIVTYDMT